MSPINDFDFLMNRPTTQLVRILDMSYYNFIIFMLNIALMQSASLLLYQIRSDVPITSVRPSSSCMRVMNHNWSATKQRLHPQSVAEISRHSVLSGDRIRQWTSSVSRHKDADQL